MSTTRCAVTTHYTWKPATTKFDVPCRNAAHAVRVRCRVPDVTAVSVYDSAGERKRFAPCINGKPSRRRRGGTLGRGQQRRRR